MKSVIYLLNKRVSIFSVLILSIISTPVLPAQYSDYTGEGIIRITFRDWPYSINEGDWRCINELGNIQHYVINVYSNDFIKGKLNAHILSLKKYGEPGHVLNLLNGDNLAGITTNEARALFAPDDHKAVIDLFKDNGGLRIIILSPRPPYFDVPVPSGKYILAYAVGFPKSKHKEFEFTCPRYSDKSVAIKANYRWGPPSIYVSEGETTIIEFAPTSNGLGTLHGEDFNWENSRTFWEYIDFLNWAGEIY